LEEEMKVERKKQIWEEADQRRMVHFQKLDMLKQEVAKHRWDKNKTTLEKK